MKTLLRFTICKELLVSLCYSSIPQELRKLVKYIAPMHLELTCRKLPTFLFILCFYFYKFNPCLILPCEIILFNSYQIPCCILLWWMHSSPFLPFPRQDLCSLHHPTHSHLHHCSHFSTWTQVAICWKWNLNKAYENNIHASLPLLQIIHLLHLKSSFTAESSHSQFTINFPADKEPIFSLFLSNTTNRSFQLTPHNFALFLGASTARQ